MQEKRRLQSQLSLGLCISITLEQNKLSVEVEHNWDCRMWFIRAIDLRTSAMAFQEVAWNLLRVISLCLCVQASNRNLFQPKPNQK